MYNFNYPLLQEFKDCCNNLLPYLEKKDEDDEIRLLEILKKYPQVISDKIIIKILNKKNINKLEIITNYLFYKTTYKKLNSEINNVYNLKNLYILISEAIDLEFKMPLKNFNIINDISSMYHISVDIILFTLLKDIKYDELFDSENFINFLRCFNDEDLTKVFSNYSEYHNIELYTLFDTLIKHNIICNL